MERDPDAIFFALQKDFRLFRTPFAVESPESGNRKRLIGIDREYNCIFVNGNRFCSGASGCGEQCSRSKKRKYKIFHFFCETSRKFIDETANKFKGCHNIFRLLFAGNFTFDDQFAFKAQFMQFGNDPFEIDFPFTDGNFMA